MLTGRMNVLGAQGESVSPVWKMNATQREIEIERWISIGIEDYFNQSNIVIIEWPEILETIIPDNAIKIKISHIDTNKREFLFI